VKLRGGIRAWSEDLAWHLKVGGRAARGRKTKLTARANQKGKCTSANTPSTRRLAGPARLNSPRERREASGAGWADGREGRKVGRAKCKEKEFLN
jgi:hypothetical protein